MFFVFSITGEGILKSGNKVIIIANGIKIEVKKVMPADDIARRQSCFTVLWNNTQAKHVTALSLRGCVSTVVIRCVCTLLCILWLS